MKWEAIFHLPRGQEATLTFDAEDEQKAHRLLDNIVQASPVRIERVAYTLRVRGQETPIRRVMREVTREHVESAMRRHLDLTGAHQDERLDDPVAAFQEYIGIERGAGDEIIAAILEVYPREVAPFVMTGVQIGILAARLAEE